MAAATLLRVGDPAPAFSLKSGDGRTVRLSELRGRTVVLYFYPKDDTPGCTREACGFRDALGALTGAGAVVLGVSRDTDASHRRFAEKYRLTFPLLSDPDAAAANAYGVYKRKSLYGRSYLGIERTTFVIDAQGRIERIFSRVQVDGHIQEVLEAIRKTPGEHQAGAPQAPRARPRRLKRAPSLRR